MDAFIGTILPVAFNFAPPDWLPCCGQILPISQNNVLFSLVGKTYGGDGISTFGLPNLQSTVIVGAYVGNQLPPNVAPYQMGQAVGVSQVVLAQNQVPLPAHTHPATFAGSSASVGNLTVTLPPISASGVLPTTSALGTTNTPGTNIGPAQIAPIPFSLAQGGNKTVNAYALADGSAKMAVNVTATYNGSPSITGGQITPSGVVTVQANNPVPPTSAVTVMQPSLALNYIICCVGIYPNRP